MTSVALTTAVTVSPFFKPISSALRRVMTNSMEGHVIGKAACGSRFHAPPPRRRRIESEPKSERSTMKPILRSATPAAMGITLLVLAALAMKSYPAAAEGAYALPPPAIDAPPGHATSAVVVLAGGCFWGVQGVFQHVRGVTGAVSGYAGGDKKSAEYEMV